MTLPVLMMCAIGALIQVKDVWHAPVPESERNGFTFAGYDAAGVEYAVTRAVDAYDQGWDWWHNTMVPRCMRQDFSWSRSAQDYLNIYHSLVPKAA